MWSDGPAELDKIDVNVSRSSFYHLFMFPYHSGEVEFLWNGAIMYTPNFRQNPLVTNSVYSVISVEAYDSGEQSSRRCRVRCQSSSCYTMIVVYVTSKVCYDFNNKV